jgi:uncharacterized protein (UPF0297 family)
MMETYVIIDERGDSVDEKMNETMKFEAAKETPAEPREILFSVFDSLEEKGYNPINQIIGYILSGDPTYITSHNNARSLIRKIERDELLEEILRAYLKCTKD